MARVGITRKIRTPHLKEQRRRRVLQNVLLVLGTVVALVLLLWQVLEMPALAVADIVVEGNRGVAVWEVEQVAETHLSGRFAWLFPRRNIFLLPRHDIKTSIRSQYPRVNTVELSLERNRVLRVVISERKPVALVCPYPFADAVPDTSCLFADADSFLFAEAPHFSGHVILSYHNEAQQAQMGTVFLPDGEFSRINSFVQSLRLLRTEPVAVTLAEDALVIHLRRGGKIFGRMDNDLILIAENLKLVLASPDFQKDILPSLQNLDYIDLRFGNKIFYKTKEIEE